MLQQREGEKQAVTTDGNGLRRLRGFLWPYRRQFGLGLTFMILTIVTDLTMPWLFGQTIDRGLASGHMGQVVLYAGLLVGTQLFRSLFMYWQWLVQQQVGQNVMKDIRDQLYQRLLDLPDSFYRSMSTGEIMSRLTGDVEAAQEYIGWGFVLQIMAVLAFAGSATLLLLLDWRLTLGTLVPIAILGLIVYRFDKKIAPAWEAERKQMGDMTRVLQEFISGIRVVKAFAQEKLEWHKFASQNAAARQRNLTRARIEAESLPLVNLFIGFAFVVLAWYGVRRVIADEMSLGVFFSYQWYLWGLIWPLQISGWLINLRRQAAAAAPRLCEILDAPVTIVDPPAARRLAAVSGEIQFIDASFAFADAPDRPVLHKLNLTIRPGELIAVLGGTGSGKSSLINLIPRFHDVTGGQVLVDGHDVRALRLADLRGQIGIVPQEPFLFSASVRDNIAYGRPEATDDDVFGAARLAQAHAFIVAMEDGYDTRIGERGVRLSGGQKQRLALARAILVDPAILILDEATSAVDTATEYEIQQALERVMVDRTSIIIAQRLSTIKHADRIVVLKDSEIVEVGNHETLLAQAGEYARIYEMQYRHQDLTLPAAAAA